MAFCEMTFRRMAFHEIAFRRMAFCEMTFRRMAFHEIAFRRMAICQITFRKMAEDCSEGICFMDYTGDGRGALYICATPIGNLEDITLRTLRILKEADLIAAEDTRNSIRLLNHYGIRTPLTAYHEFNKYEKAEELVRLMRGGKNVALITDAGTPCISDPGEVLARMAAENGIAVSSLPGPSACIAALTLSRLSTRRFAFEAFLPSEKTDKKERRRVLDSLRNETRTIVLYEAPHHLKKTLAELSEILGASRRITLCRELTKIHEEILTGSIGSVLLQYETEEPRGEYVLVVEGKPVREVEEEMQAVWKDLSPEEHVRHYLEQGMAEKDAMKAAAKDRGISRRELYRILKT